MIHLFEEERHNGEQTYEYHLQYSGAADLPFDTRYDRKLSGNPGTHHAITSLSFGYAPISQI